MIWRFFVLIVFIPAVYALFGWVIAEQSVGWSRCLEEQARILDITASTLFFDRLIYALSSLLILVIVLSLTVFSDGVSLLFVSWFKTDLRAIVSVLGWSLAIVFILYWFYYAIQVAVLLSATILGKIELHEAGLNNFQVLPVLLMMCLGTYIVGIQAHNIWSHLF